MNRVWRTFPALLAVVVGATAVHAASSPKEITAPAPLKPVPERIEAPRMGVQQLWDLDLRRWPEERFYENVTAQIDLLSKVHGSEGVAVLMDAAEIYLGQMMVYEAGSVLDGLTAVGPAQERRLMALQHARLLLEGVAVEGFDTSPLSEVGRADRAFWAAMQAIATADAALLTANLEPGLLGLMHQTRPVARTVLPILTEAMIESGAEAMAGQALRLMDEFPDLAEGSVGSYLRGRASQVRNDQAAALTSYFEAAKGWDRFAARSRLALADMALEDGGRGALLAAKDVLEYGADSWKGDGLEVATLQSLARVYTANQDSVEALMTHGKIMLRFPATEAAARAEREAAGALAEVYRSGEAGELPMSRWLSVHYQLVPAFRYYDQFPDYVERVGDHLLIQGGTAMAAKEYQRALDLRRDMVLHYPNKAEPEREFQLRFKLAQAYATGGQFANAKDLLMALDVPADQQKRNQVNALRADVMAQLGDKDGLLRTHVQSPSATNLRNVGRALWTQEDWGEARLFFDRLWTEYPGQFNVDDATYLLIAAYRSGDIEAARRVVDAFPGLTESEGLMQVAQSLLAQPADVFPLTLNGAQKRMDSLEESLNNLSNSGL